MIDLSGRTLGQYRLLEKVGSGGMATIYKAYQPSLDRYVAMKILPPYYAHEPGFEERFDREAKAVAKLTHPHILPIHDFGRDGELSYIVMQYVDAGTLADMLGKPLSLVEAAKILGQVADALDYAHEQGILHRDVKPSNVLMQRGDWALLTDFGLARMVEGSSRLTASGVGVGTPAYMSPEQGQALKVDHRTDIYSMGIMLYEMLTGRLPYEAETPLAVVLKHISDPLPLPRAANPNLPEDAERVILKAVAKNPDDRFESAGEMAEALTKVSQGMETDIQVPAIAAMKQRDGAAHVHAKDTSVELTRPEIAATGEKKVNQGLNQGLIIGLAAAGLFAVLVVVVLAAMLVFGRTDHEGGIPPGDAGAPPPGVPEKGVAYDDFEDIDFTDSLWDMPESWVVREEDGNHFLSGMEGRVGLKMPPAGDVRLKARVRVEKGEFIMTTRIGEGGSYLLNNVPGGAFGLFKEAPGLDGARELFYSEPDFVREGDGEWHTWELLNYKERITFLFDGKPVLDVIDQEHLGEGMVAFEVTPGSAVDVDDFLYEALEGPPDTYLDMPRPGEAGGTPPGEPVPYGDDFEGGLNKERWEVMGDWVLLEKEGNHFLRGRSGEIALNMPPAQNLLVRARVRIENGKLLMVGRATGDSGYSVQNIQAGGFVILKDLPESDRPVEMGWGAEGYVPDGQWHTWEVLLFDEHILISFDRVPVLHQVDPELLGAGAVLLSAGPETTADVDEFFFEPVHEYPPYLDEIPVGRIFPEGEQPPPPEGGIICMVVPPNYQFSLYPVFKEMAAGKGWEPRFYGHGPSQEQFKDMLKQAAEEGCGFMFITNSAFYEPTVVDVATHEADVSFVVMNAQNMKEIPPTIPPNVRLVNLNYSRGCFAAGVVAAAASRGNPVGYIAGPGNVGIEACDKSYEEGAKLFNDGQEVIGGYASSFNDPQEGVKIADFLTSEGVQVIFNMASETGSAGIMHAAADNGLWVIGSESDQYVTLFEDGGAPGADRILTSVVVDYGAVMQEEVTQVLNGDFVGDKFMEYGKNEEDEGVYVYLAPAHDAKPDIAAPALQIFKRLLQRRLDQ